MKNIFCLTLCFLFYLNYIFAQENNNDNKKVDVLGSIQTDILIPQKDKYLGIDTIEHHFLTNTYIDVNATSKYFDAGIRAEYMVNPLPGFDSDFSGWGIPHFYLKGKLKNIDLTLGHFYEQFGSGFILRTYEERSLGIDNALLGARLKVLPFNGVNITLLTGKQRRYWKINKSTISGANIELNLEQWFKNLQKHNTYLTFGASFVNKYESDETILVDQKYKLNLPKNVSAIDVRLQLQHKSINILAEYAYKSQDPTQGNNYIYRNGYVAMLSASYSKKRMSVLLQAKRSVNMDFRSKRSEVGLASTINNLPAFTTTHTYALAALYPYATHPEGEWAYQAMASYSFKKHSALGGRYGTKIKFNASHVVGIKTNYLGSKGSNGYGSAFWQWGNSTFYQDLNLTIEKPLSKRTLLYFIYMKQIYNETIVKGEGSTLHNHIFIVDLKHKISKHNTIRIETQYLHSKEENGKWAFALSEMSFAPHFAFSLSDLYNIGNPHSHYYQAFAIYAVGAHRLQVGYGKTRAGYNCASGVCRYIPATKGFTLSYNFNF